MRCTTQQHGCRARSHVGVVDGIACFSSLSPATMHSRGSSRGHACHAGAFWSACASTMGMCPTTCKQSHFGSIHTVIVLVTARKPQPQLTVPHGCKPNCVGQAYCICALAQHCACLQHTMHALPLWPACSRARVKQATVALLSTAKRVLPQKQRQQLAKVEKQAAVAASRAARKESAGTGVQNEQVCGCCSRDGVGTRHRSNCNCAKE